MIENETGLTGAQETTLLDMVPEDRIDLLNAIADHAHRSPVQQLYFMIESEMTSNSRYLMTIREYHDRSDGNFIAKLSAIAEANFRTPLQQLTLMIDEGSVDFGLGNWHLTSQKLKKEIEALRAGKKAMMQENKRLHETVERRRGIVAQIHTWEGYIDKVIQFTDLMIADANAISNRLAVMSAEATKPDLSIYKQTGPDLSMPWQGVNRIPARQDLILVLMREDGRIVVGTYVDGGFSTTDGETTHEAVKGWMSAQRAIQVFADIFNHIHEFIVLGGLVGNKCNSIDGLKHELMHIAEKLKALRQDIGEETSTAFFVRSDTDSSK